jgi:hypothetical protein
LNNTGLPKVNVILGTSPEEQPEVDVSDEEFLQFDTSTVPAIVTLTKVFTSLHWQGQFNIYFYYNVAFE